MPKLPTLSGRVLCKILERKGFVFVRQKGSHMMLRRTSPPYVTITVPDHRELARGTLHAVLRDADLTAEELLTLLGEL